MQAISQPSTTRAWAKAITQTAAEFPPTPLPVLSGEIPVGLQGTLYRNGPGRLERGGMRVGHWFDGDGAILSVHFTATGVTGVYRFVQTQKYQDEAKAGQLLYSNYGMKAPGPFWNQWLRPVKNAANTSVLALPDKLLALWEGGNPYALDLETLDTWAQVDLGGLTKDLPYSAHPKVDPETGEIFNFGISLGQNATLNLYRSQSNGQIQQKAAIELEGFPLIHDFVLAGPYLVFFLPPIRLNPLAVLFGFSTYSDSFSWQPQLGTQFLVFDRENLTLVSRGETEPWYQWHFANGYLDESGAIVVDVARYEDFQTNQFLKEVATGQTHTPAKSTLWRIHLNPQLSKLTSIKEILDWHCEFPVVPQQYVGQAAPCTFLSVNRQGVDISQEIFGEIARFDHKTETLTVTELGENCYPMEPIYAPDAAHPDQGWIIIVVYNGNTETSEVQVYDSKHLDSAPICRLGLPSVIPIGFHGTWKSA